MRRRKKDRVEQLGQTIAALPIRQKVLDEAMEWFVTFGELYDEHHVAVAVVERVLAESQPERANSAAHRLTLGQNGTPGATRLRSLHPDKTSVREILFFEALHTEDPKRQYARLAIAVEVAYGGKVMDPRFAAHHGFPAHGSLGMHVIGYPQKLAQPPYVDQAHRLFGRQERIRASIDHNDPDWFDPMETALLAFLNHGTLPADELLLEWVLTEAEMQALWGHKRGEDVSELMAAFDTAAKATTDQRAAAVQAAVAAFTRFRASQQADQRGTSGS